MAWFRPLGVAEVAYHQATVVGRDDDHPGAALAYYGSRGETPLRWGGAGAARLGLAGEVTFAGYEAAFGPGGFRHPETHEVLVVTRRPGFELVVSAHKTVAVLGVMDRAEEMHSILDVETAATMEWLDCWFQGRGGRRGRVQARTATGGLTYAVTRHATSRAGDPSPHDHVLVANVVEMLDSRGGYKALDSAGLRDTVEAATMVGRLHAAARAVELGFDIEADNGPSGNLRHWRIVGIPDEVCELFSKRSDQIAEHLAETGERGYRARGVAARATRSVKRHTGADELLPAWRGELHSLGWPVERLAEHLAASQQQVRALRFPMTAAEIDALAAEVLHVDGRLLANHKAFTRTHLVAEIAPRLYGRDPGELDRALDRILASPTVVPLIGVHGTREQSYTTVEVLTTEATIARTLETLATQPGPALEPDQVAPAIADAEDTLGHPLTSGQRRVVEQLCGGGRAAGIVIGVAGSGKTTALDAAARALEAAGYQVLGTSTSGQAARTLGAEAHIEARTFASMLWRLDHAQISLDDRTVVVVDESGMADDANLARLALAVERAGASLVLVGDPHQLAAVGPGGALAGLIARHPELTATLDTNVRQHNPAERAALAELRDGSVATAIDWYTASGRVHAHPDRIETLTEMTDAWAADLGDGHHTALLAWRRADVTDLNRLARDRWDRAGRLHGDDVEVAPGRWYAVGDRLVALAPNPAAGIVTSEQLDIVDLDEDHLDVRTAGGRIVQITGEGLDPEHLDYGYALTVHRAQGATYQRAHVLAAGGGRELAYVALSRAREQTNIYATADDLPQAVGDLDADWGIERHQRWITDTPAEPGREPDPATCAPTITDPPSEPTLDERLATARHHLNELAGDYQALHAGTGRWHHTPEGAAARHRTTANENLDQARRAAQDPNSRRRDQRAAGKVIPELELSSALAEQRWQTIGQPMADRIGEDIRDARRTIDRLEAEHLTQRLDDLQQRTAARTLGQDLGISL